MKPYIFRIYQDKQFKWRWRLKAPNGNIVADSAQGYTRKNSAYEAAGKLVDMLQGGHIELEKP